MSDALASTSSAASFRGGTLERGMLNQVICKFEVAGYSWLGPTALNIHAPDEGNIHLMEEVATHEQKERWLRPQVAGKTRSCFAMTEPSPGAGADPSMLVTAAVRDGDDYVING